LNEAWHTDAEIVDQAGRRIRAAGEARYRKESPVDRAMHVVYKSIGDDLNYYNGRLSGRA